ncbi:MAG TPA: DUF6094 domain-containing protein [Terriglobales bacterium]|nr:DUF6094 domain-containing protein [Terriglobales bacterium]
MRPHGQTKLGFFPLPIAEAKRLRKWLKFQDRFSAVDPCIGNGVAFRALLGDASTSCYGIEIDVNRSQQARSLGIDVLHANAMDVRCAAESVSLLYLNPPYNWECGEGNNQRLEYLFLEHTFRWLKPAGVLIFVIPQIRLAKCARLLAEQFSEVRIFRLTEAECVQYKQIVILATRRKRHARLSDAALVAETRFLEAVAIQNQIASLAERSEVRYEVPKSGPLLLTNTGIPLDEVEDLLLESSAYRQAARVLLPNLGHARGRPLTPLHGGHVGLLCTAGMLNGVFGDGEERHIAHWRSIKFTDHWEEEEEDGTKILHDRERFSHELTLVFADGKTQILTHEKKEGV